MRHVAEPGADDGAYGIPVNAQPVIEAHELGKNYSTAPVLRSIELAIRPGQGAVVIGSNGTGKSTLIRVLAGLAAPSSGRALLFGEQARGLPAQRRVKLGVLTHQSFLYPNLTARENLVFFGRLYAVPSPESSAQPWIDRVGLRASADERVRALSRGMEQRLAIARAMLAEPEALLLDEPLSGLDADGVALVSGLMTERIAHGCAVMVTAHTADAFAQFNFDRYELKQGRLTPTQSDRTTRLRMTV